jgi:hypothetical protein
VNTLQALGVPQPLIDEVVAGVALLAADIVHPPSSTAGHILKSKFASNGRSQS